MISDERRSEIMLGNITKSDCGVIALQAITNLPRRQAEELAREKAAYTDTGTPRGGLERALMSLGYEVEAVQPDPSETAATFAIRKDSGKYLVYISEHVMALVDGDLHNSRSFFRHPVTAITRVTDKREGWPE